MSTKQSDIFDANSIVLFCLMLTGFNFEFRIKEPGCTRPNSNIFLFLALKLFKKFGRLQFCKTMAPHALFYC